jgi:hypothetical protein
MAFKRLLAAALVALPVAALAQTSEPAKPPETQPTAPPAAPATPAPAAEPAKPAAETAKPAEAKPAEKKAEPSVKITPYGFVLANGFWPDRQFTSTGTNRANDFPFAAAADASGAQSSAGAFLMSARQSRFGVRLALKDDNWTGAEFAGQVEFDFKAGHLATASTSWNAGVMRLRIATATAIWKTSFGNFSLLAGQDYGLVNPLFAESASWVADPVFWTAGNVWRRTPQFRATLTPQVGPVGVSIAAAILSPSDRESPVDYGAGNASRQPDYEARVAGTVKPMKDVSATVGVGYHTNVRRYGALTTAQKDVTATLVGVDADVNATQFLQVKGEWYTGKGIDDTYNSLGPGTLNATTATATAPDYVDVQGDGFWAQAILKPLPMIWVVGGYGMARNTASDLDRVTGAAARATTRQENVQMHGGVILNAGKFWRVAAEAIQANTKYLDGKKFDSRMYALSSMFRF